MAIRKDSCSINFPRRRVFHTTKTQTGPRPETYPFHLVKAGSIDT